MATQWEHIETQRARRDRERGNRFEPGARRVAMAYPSPYRAGMSSLGYQWVLAQLRDAGLAAERVFLPDDVAAYRATRTPPLSYESETPLSEFPLVLISLAYELELAGLIELLELAGIPARREDRRPGDPLVLLGGPITFSNPLPAAPFVDAMLVGEADETAVPAAASFFECDTRESWLDAIADLPGAFVPERDGIVLPAVAKASDVLLPARSFILSPDAELSDMFLIEGERGCHRMCTFCVMRRSTNGGMRLVTSERILGFVPEAAPKVGFVGAAISDHPELVDLLDTVHRSGRQVSVSSLRADRLAKRPRIAEILRAGGARTLTTASDAATEALRKTISKGTAEKHLITVAKQAGELNFQTLKVYMMLGVPGEVDDDIEELARFTNEMAGHTKVALGIAPFVAKRNTPLDKTEFAGINAVERRIKRLRKLLDRKRAEVRSTSARWAWVEYVLAQGGPPAGEAVYRAVQDGGGFAAYKRAFRDLEALVESRSDALPHHHR